MPHFPKPFFVKARGVWRVQVHGKQVNLGPDRDAAFRRYHELLSRPAPVQSDLAVGVIDGFLDWCERHRAARTYEWYKDHLQSFIDSLAEPERLRVEDVKPFHVLTWADGHPKWGNSHRRGAITAVQRAFAWAEKVGHIDKSPVRHVEKPEYGRREQVISPAEYQRLLEQVPDQQFRDVLVFAWETGARPQEVRLIEARHLDLDRGRVVLPPAESKGKKRFRVIYLTEQAEAIVRRLGRSSGTRTGGRGRPRRSTAGSIG